MANETRKMMTTDARNWFRDGDGDLKPAEREPCYAAWTLYRDSFEPDDIVPDLTSYRAGFMAACDRPREAEGDLVERAKAMYRERMTDKLTGYIQPAKERSVVRMMRDFAQQERQGAELAGYKRGYAEGGKPRDLETQLAYEAGDKAGYERSRAENAEQVKNESTAS